MPKASLKNVALLVAVFAAAAVFALTCVLAGPMGNHRTLFELAGERAMLVLAAAALIAAAVGFGLAGLKLLKITPENLMNRLVVAGGLGLGLLAFVVLVLGALGALSQPVVLVLIGIGAALGCWTLTAQKIAWKPKTNGSRAQWILILTLILKVPI